MWPTSLWKTNTSVYQKSHLWPTMKAGTSFRDFRDILHRNVSGLAEELHVPVNWHHFLRTESRIFWTVHHPIATNAYFKDTSTGWGPFQESWGWKSAETSPSRTRVPLGAQRNSGGKRGGWWWKMDVCGGRVPYGTLPGSNNPGSGSQIPNPTCMDHQQEDKRTDHKSASTVSFRSSITVFFCIAFHILSRMYFSTWG